MRVWAPVGAVFVWAILALGVMAQTIGARAELNRALGIPELLEIMREEGHAYGKVIGADFLPDGGGASWSGVVARIYDTDKMAQSVNKGMEAQIAPEQLEPLLAFFKSDTGQKIIQQELGARRAFLNEATEQAAREAFKNVGPDQAERIGLLREYIEINGLIEFNVAGALTANLKFYRGLSEGGAWDVAEDEMLAQVWEQEAEIRADTEEWLMAYLLMAYAPLSDEEVRSYVELSKTAAGKALNRALFIGFDAMYGDVSYALGLAVALQMKGEDL